ncbi:MAG: hypothetical protein HYU70_09190 [Bacteroidetes bacterium]|nr:hypothetical protein [Bacteroidota bacterium]
MKWLLSFILLLGHVKTILAQPSQVQHLLPKILPPSPNAAAFEKYGNYPVNMYTGVPQISIPLYEIQVGSLKLPITLNYHASGFKVSERASRMGLGWSLDGTGAISRRVMGKPDEQDGNYLNAATVRNSSTISSTNADDLLYLRFVSEGAKDAEPDIFSYRFPGKSGKFLFNQQNNYAPVMLPYDPIKINLIRPTSTTALFDITNESGTIFRFRDYESSSNGGIGNAPSTWLMTKMVAANNNDSISLNYSTRYGQTSDDIADYTIVNDKVSNYAGSYSHDVGTTYTSNPYVYVDERILDEIVFRNGKVVFESAPIDREDGFTGQKRLAAIKVFSLHALSNTYVLLKSFTFFHSYFINAIDGAKRLRLDSLSCNDNTGSVIQMYRFEYNNDIVLPSYSSRSRDYWGYYNGKYNNSLVPRMEIPYQTTSYATPSTIWIGSDTYNGREPDPYYMSACILKKIHFPTGGYTEFEFEANKYKDEQDVVRYAGGLRIKTIKSYDAVLATPVVKTYKYGVAEAGTGRANYKLSNYFFQNEQTYRKYADAGYNCPQLQATKRVRTFVSNPSIEMEPYDGSIVAYPVVTEYSGDETANTGKTVFTFNDRADGMNTVAAYGRPILTSYYFNRGQITDQSVYKNEGAGNYRLIHKTENQYSAFDEQWNSYMGLVVFKWQISENEYSDNNDKGVQPSCDDDRYSYRYMNYSVRAGDNKLTKTTQTTYDATDSLKFVQQVTDYYYDNFNHQQVTRVQTTNSKLQSLVVQRKYPHEFSATAPYNAMIAKNMINNVVEEQTTNNANNVIQKITTFTDLANGNYLPSALQIKNGADPLENRVLFSAYDIHGNILSMSKSNDQTVTYLWNYQKIYPIAEITNAAHGNVAYSSFEADDNGNWDYSAAGVNMAEGFTGKYSFSLPTASIQRTGLNSTQTYLVTYWLKDASGSVSVGGTALVSKNGWTLYQTTVSGVTSLTISGTGLIDELRLYPKNAQMTTYTYEPLVGMTSQCDTNNKVIYYEYDGLGRLKLIRDQDKNILKTFDYQYRQVQ